MLVIRADGMTSDSRTNRPFIHTEHSNIYHVYDCAASAWMEFVAKFVAGMKLCPSVSFNRNAKVLAGSQFILGARNWSEFYMIIIIYSVFCNCRLGMRNLRFELFDMPLNNILRDARVIRHLGYAQTNVQMFRHPLIQVFWYGSCCRLRCTAVNAPKPERPEGHPKFSNKIKWFMCSDTINWYLLY